MEYDTLLKAVFVMVMNIVKFLSMGFSFGILFISVLFLNAIILLNVFTFIENIVRHKLSWKIHFLKETIMLVLIFCLSVILSFVLIVLFKVNLML